MAKDAAGRVAWDQLTLGTVSFALCFAAWGLIGALAPRFAAQFRLSGLETGLLVATPVLLGSLARLPVGILGDRFGGRAVFTVLMLVTAVPTALVPFAPSYAVLLAVAFGLGLAGSSFSVGVGYVSRWAPRERQGTVLGIYGAGNVGQSIAVFFAPVLVKRFGTDAPVFLGAAALLAVWAIAFWLMARNAPVAVRRSSMGQMLGFLRRQPLAWVLSAFYFLTFGGFVAFSIYLPTLLKSEFQLEPADAGLRVAGFVVLATAMRPIGGWLADRIGGAHLLRAVFVAIIPFALLLMWTSIVPFTVGALGCAAFLGLGNGAVFKLVGQHFAAEAGTVSGLVGAFGGLGGFFPPLLLGLFRDTLHALWPGFVLLAAVALALAVMNERVFLRREEAEEATEGRREAPIPARAAAWATLWTALLVAAIVVGSRNLANFDPALVVYTFATIFATWGVAYHYYVWLQKPPTRLYWRRGWELFVKGGLLRNLGRLVPLLLTHIAAQTFIRPRSTLRWWMHLCLFWGCVLAAAVTFPLVWGWVHFRSAPGDPMTYVAYLFGFPAGRFPIRTPLSWTIFHLLDIAAVLVLAGIGLSLWRRMRDLGARAVQDFARDLMPIVLLFAVSVTGLALTVSSLWLRGSFYGFLSIIHAITVIATLLYLPFGKLFHIFQRPAQLGVRYYKAAGAAGPGLACVRCGTAYASRMHVDDLAGVLRELDFDYRMPDGDAGLTWQRLCPMCKRVALAQGQLELKEVTRGQATAS